MTKIASTKKVLVAIVALSQSASAKRFTWTNEFRHYVPSCARQCFLNFLDGNFDLDEHGHTPPLKKLCAVAGSNDLTIGEGAMQCMVSEHIEGLCSDLDANGELLYKAHDMCDGQPDAVKPTHSVLTASRISAPTTTPGRARPYSTATTAQDRTRVTDSTLIYDTRTSPNPPHPKTSKSRSTLTTSVSRSNTPTSDVSSSPTTTTTSTALPVADEKQEDNKSSSNLNTGQVIGISVGAAAAIGILLIIGLVVRFRLRRKKENSSQDDQLSGEGFWDYRFAKGTDSRTASWVANQSRTRLDPPPPPVPPKSPEGSTNVHRGTVGMAFTPSTPGDASSAAVPQTAPPRPLSKLLPAKPSMALHDAAANTELNQNGQNKDDLVDKKNDSPPTARYRSGPPTLPKLRIPSSSGLLFPFTGQQKHDDSPATEFEEDRSSALSPVGQIWRPPQTMSKTAYYVADGNGNWVLGDTKKVMHLAELEATSPQSAIPQSAVEKVAMAATVLRPPPPKHFSPDTQPNAVLPPTANIRSSSAPMPGVHRQAPGSFNAAKIGSLVMPLSPPRGEAAPAPLFSGNPNPRNFSNPQRPSSRSLTRPRAPSADSGVTTIIMTDSSDESPEPDPSLSVQEPDNANKDLSPVFESPHSAVGVSPVSYPKIQGRQSKDIAFYNDADSNLNKRDGSPARGAAHARRPSADQGKTIRVVPPTASGMPEPTAPRTLGLPKSGPWVPVSSYNPQSGIGFNAPNGLGQQTPMIAITKPDTTLRTGSPVMRAVEPSPEPENRNQQSLDDRGMLPSSRTRTSSYIGQPNVQLHHDPQSTSYAKPQYRPQQQSGQERPSLLVQTHMQPQAQLRQPQTSLQPPRQVWGLPADPRPNRQLNFNSSYYQGQQQTSQLHPPLHQIRPPAFRIQTPQHHQQPFQPLSAPNKYHPQQQQQQQQPYVQQRQSPHPNAYPQSQPQPRARQHSQQYLQPPPQIRASQLRPQQRTTFHPPPQLRSHLQPEPSPSDVAATLLTKRLGSDRAAHMALPTDKRATSHAKWRKGDDGYSSGPRTPRQPDSGDLPSTPTWLPTLTPTRRGDDMFLNVR